MSKQISGKRQDEVRKAEDSLILNAINILQSRLEKAEAENERLRIQLDMSKEYATIKLMESCNKKHTFSWRALKKRSQEMKKDTIDVFDVNYGTVKAYHRDVWFSVYGEQLDSLPDYWEEDWEEDD